MRSSPVPPPATDGRPGTGDRGGSPSAATSARRDAAIAAALALGLLLVYLANGGLIPTKDAAPSLYSAANLLEDGRLAFTPGRDPWMYDWNAVRGGEVLATLRLTDLETDLGGRTARERWREGDLAPSRGYWLAPTRRRDPATGQPLDASTFGVGAPLAALPALAVARALAGDLRRSPEALWYGGKVAASVLVALSAALVYLACRRSLRPVPALLLAAAYGLGTCVWSVSSQTLWQHAPAELFLALGAYGLLRARDLEAGPWLAGAGFALATACRPTSAIFAVAAAVWLLAVDRRRGLRLVAAAAPVAIALAAYNAWTFGSPLRFGQTVVGPALAESMTGRADQWQTPLASGLAGILVSPSRGLFVFSPFLLAALPGAVLAFRRPALAALRPLAIAAALATVVAAKHYDWWGGWTYGYRHVVDLAPVLVLLVVPVVDILAPSRLARAALALSLAWSVGLQALGAFAFDMEGWNARTGVRVRLPSGEVVTGTEDELEGAVAAGGTVIDSVPMNIGDPAFRHRLWSVRDGQIAYSLAHAAEIREKRRADAAGWIAWWRVPPPR